MGFEFSYGHNGVSGGDWHLWPQYLQYGLTLADWLPQTQRLASAGARRACDVYRAKQLGGKVTERYDGGAMHLRIIG